MWIEEKKLHEGAEAIVTSGYWLGKPAIKKFRRPRKWRHPELDSRLTKSRLTSEVRTLLKLQQLDFPTPSIFNLDLKNGIMFYLITNIVKRLIEDKKPPKCLQYWSMDNSEGKGLTSWKKRMLFEPAYLYAGQINRGFSLNG